jgi:hypothetical protein
MTHDTVADRGPFNPRDVMAITQQCEFNSGGWYFGLRERGAGSECAPPAGAVAAENRQPALRPLGKTSGWDSASRRSVV